jgi:hypothetical protein
VPPEKTVPEGEAGSKGWVSLARPKKKGRFAEIPARITFLRTDFHPMKYDPVSLKPARQYEIQYFASQTAEQHPVEEYSESVILFLFPGRINQPKTEC